MRKRLLLIGISAMSICLLAGCGIFKKEEQRAPVMTREEALKEETKKTETEVEINEAAEEDTQPPSSQTSDVTDFFNLEGASDYQKYMQIFYKECEELFKNDNGTKQSDIESDTLQWVNASYAILTEWNGDNRKLVGGRERNAENAVFMRVQLLEGWNIYDRVSAQETIFRLEQGGHRKQFKELAEGLGEEILNLSEEEFTDLLYDEGLEYEAVTKLVMAQRVYQKYGDKGLLAWDYCRVNQLYGWGYVAGYFSLEETMEGSLAASKVLQESFSSWDDMAYNYLYGLYYWRGEDPEYQYTESYKRTKIYENMKKLDSSPYALDFNMELERNWQAPLPSDISTTIS